MAYDTQEDSADDGSPIEVYDIAIGSDSWHFCTSEDSITLSAVVYTPLAVSRDAVPLNPSERTQEFSFTIPSDHEFPLRYRQLAPGEKATITIRRVHRTDGTHEVRNLYKGTVLAVATTNDGATASIGSTAGTSSFTVDMPRYVYSALCNHVLGDRWCMIALETGTAVGGLPYKHSNTVTSVTNKDIVVGGIVGAGYPDNFFQGGVLVTTAGDRRLIVKQTGDHCYVYIPPFEGVALVGTTVAVYAGCDHSFATCVSKFDNGINFGGFPFVTLGNPFTNGVT